MATIGDIPMKPEYEETKQKLANRCEFFMHHTLPESVAIIEDLDNGVWPKALLGNKETFDYCEPLFGLTAGNVHMQQSVVISQSENADEFYLNEIDRIENYCCVLDENGEWQNYGETPYDHCNFMDQGVTEADIERYMLVELLEYAEDNGLNVFVSGKGLESA
jgi:hypothetical protein